MSLLQTIIIQGEIRFGYAQLALEFEFANRSTQDIAARYFFPLPRNGRITGLQVMDRERRMLRAPICPLTEQSLQESGVRLLQVSDTCACLEWERLEAAEVSRLLIQLVLPLTHRKNGARLTLPLGIAKDMAAGSAERCDVAITLYVNQSKLRALSPSHEIAIRHTDTAFEITAAVQSGADFVLDMQGEAESASAIIQAGWEESIGVYRVFAKRPELYQRSEPKRILLALDVSGVYREEKRRGIKELLFRTLQSLPEETPVQVITSECPRTPLFPDFVQTDEERLQTAFHALEESGGGSLAELLTAIPNERDLLVILVSGGMPEQMSEVRRCIRPALPIHLFTLGELEQTELSEFWRQSAWGLHAHFYPQEVLAQELPPALARIAAWKSAVQITSAEGGVQELLLLPGADLAVDGYQDFAVCTTGKAPMKFMIWQDGMMRESVTVERGQSMEYFPMAEQIYGVAKLSRMEALAQRSDGSSLRAIKAEMAKVAVRCGILSTETIFCVRLAQAETQAYALPVRFCLAGSDRFSRPTIFGEDGAFLLRHNKREAELLAAFCVERLRMSVREDGSVRDAWCIDPKQTAEQTAFAVLALLLDIEKDRSLAPILTDGMAYVAKRVLEGLAGELYARREEWQTFLQRERMMLRKCLPSMSALAERVTGSYSDVTACAQLRILLYLESLD